MNNGEKDYSRIMDKGEGVQNKSPKILRTSYVNASSAVEIKYGQVHQEQAGLNKPGDGERGKCRCENAVRRKHKMTTGLG